LATIVSESQQTIGYASLPRQLVHGDFWDTNVLYRRDDIVLIHDFDHMGERARIEDVALTLYYMSSEPAADLETDRRMRLLGRLVAAYDSGLETRLTAAEKAALPLALARQPLWSIGGWVADLDADRAARLHLAGMDRAIDFALEIMRELPRWQAAFSLA
jgi:Ser/Thr protein kinase RdoA (MazF antagonist)